MVECYKKIKSCISVILDSSQYHSWTPPEKILKPKRIYLLATIARSLSAVKENS